MWERATVGGLDVAGGLDCGAPLLGAWGSSASGGHAVAPVSHDDSSRAIRTPAI